MPIACKICIAKKGLTKDSKWIFETQKELNKHLEDEHGFVITDKEQSEANKNGN